MDFIVREGGFVMITEQNFGVGFMFYILTKSGSLCKCLLIIVYVQSIKYMGHKSVDAAIFNDNNNV